MKIAVISDIHGNDVAFKKILKELSEYSYVINLGDSVGDEGDSDRVIELLNRYNIRSILGNHDIEVILNRSIGADRLTAEMLYKTKAIYGNKIVLKPENLNYLKLLKLNLRIKHSGVVYGFYHSFYDYYKEDIFFESVKKSKNNALSLIEKTACDVTFIGHTHIPQVILADRDKTIRYQTVRKTCSIDYADNINYIINTGSIGNSRDPKIDCCYSVIDTDSNEIHFIVKQKTAQSE